MMNIGIRLHDTAGTLLEERLDNAKAQGFTCAHLAMQKALPDFRMADAPALLTDEVAARVREDDGEARKAWDELEKSVVARVADDVKVSIRGRVVEMTLLKKMA